MAAALFDAAIAAFTPTLPFAVALSGGADSTALLTACAARWPGRVRALHVHHGLQKAADEFEAHCRDLCARLRVPLAVQHVDAKHASGQSPEAAARDARYAALARMAAAADAFEGGYGRDLAVNAGAHNSIHAGQAGQAGQAGIESVALAQHADDQVETLLLALSRGAGLPGVAAMPACLQRHGTTFVRPLLAVPRESIRDWLQQRDVQWIEDPSNADVRFVRNRIRARVLPALEATFPAFRATFARSAAHVAEAQTLLVELAAGDLALCGQPPRLEALRQFSRGRRANLLRYWLMHVHGRAPTTAQLNEWQAQIEACVTRDHSIHIKVADGFVERRGEVLDWYNRRPSP